MDIIRRSTGVYVRKDHGKYSKYFICPECFKITVVKGYLENYIDNYKSFEENENIKVTFLGPNIKCNCDDCDGFMFECDEHMVDSVVKFNKSGFLTTFCCEGHYKKYETESISVPYIEFADIDDHNWQIIIDTLYLSILYDKWKEYFQINHLERIMMNLENKHPISIMNNDRQIHLNWEIFSKFDITEQEFEQLKFYFCTVINQVAYILSDEE